MRTKEYDMICILRKWLDDIKAKEKELGNEGLKVQVYLGYEEVKLLSYVLEKDYYTVKESNENIKTEREA